MLPAQSWPVMGLSLLRPIFCASCLPLGLPPCPCTWGYGGNHFMDCNPLGSSVQGILQARILDWVAIPFSRGSNLGSPALQSDSFPYEPPGKPISTTSASQILKGELRCWIGEGNGTPLQYSCLENPMDGGAWWAAVHEVAKSRTWLSDFTFTFHFHALEKEMATHSSALAWRIPGTEEPGRRSSMGSHRVGHDWSDLAAAAAADVEWSSLTQEWKASATHLRGWFPEHPQVHPEIHGQGDKLWKDGPTAPAVSSQGLVWEQHYQGNTALTGGAVRTATRLKFKNGLKVAQGVVLLLLYSYSVSRLPQWLSSKESTCKAGATGDTGSIPGSGRSSGGGHSNPPQYSCLENPMDRGAWQTTVHGVAKSQTQLKQLSTHANCIHSWKSHFANWRRKKKNLSTTLESPTSGPKAICNFSGRLWGREGMMMYLLAPLPIYIHFQSPSNSEDIQPQTDQGVQKYTPYQMEQCLKETLMASTTSLHCRCLFLKPTWYSSRWLTKESNLKGRGRKIQ